MKSKTKLLAVAVAGIFSGGAFAQSNVQIYGTLNLNVQSTDRSGATAAGTAGLATLAAAASGVNVNSRNAMSTDSSNIGFRGAEDLGGGLKATFQIESSVGLDGQNATSLLASRNSKVGLAGTFGEVFFGNWDTPFKAVTYGTKVNDPFNSTDSTAYQSIMSSPGFKQRSGGYVSGTNNAAFDGRAANSVAYWSPKFDGFGVKLAYSANEGKTATLDPSLWSLAANYDNGPLSALYAYERRNDAFGLTVIQAASTGTASKDAAHRFGFGYMFGGTTLGALWERLDYNNTGRVAGVTSYKRDAWQLSLLHSMGPHAFKLRYNQAQDGACSNVASICSTKGLGAKSWTLGYGYSLSKRSEAYLFYTKIANRESASYTFGVAGSADVTTGTYGVGSDPQALGLGLRHTF
ncbi:MAG: porin [Sterolibacterium sp.]|jgi:predicted porin